MHSVPCIFAALVYCLLLNRSQAYRNLVIPGLTTATQSSTYKSFSAEKTIDGYPDILGVFDGSCSHTDTGQTQAWLKIDLDKVYNVKAVRFWYRNDRISALQNTIRLHYYSLYFYNESGSPVICYTDNTNYNTPIPMPSTIECSSKTRTIEFYTSQPNLQDGGQVFLEICEVEIFGCDSNQYGENCYDCNNRCTDCDITRGCVSCQGKFTGSECNLCLPGYMGNNCGRICTTGWYGQNCSMECSNHCLDNDTCFHVNGTCLRGCAPGYRGPTCSNECINGSYGLGCLENCSGNCFGNQTCDFISGRCQNGCTKGWSGSNCFTSCSNGTYGENCQYNCSGNCFQNETCNRYEGYCPNGCDIGWDGEACDRECPSGTFGFHCNSTCGDGCKDRMCHSVTGACTLGCRDGWIGGMCDQACPEGSFGRDCFEKCGRCVNNTCDHVNGSCSGPCQDGWEGGRCLMAKALISPADTPDRSNSLMVGAVVGAVSLLAVIAVTAILLIRVRRKRLNNAPKGPAPYDTKDHNTYMNAAACIPDAMSKTIDPPVTVPQTTEPPQDPVYSNSEDPPIRNNNSVGKISITRLVNVVTLGFVNSYKDLRKEYQAIPYGEQDHIPCNHGKLPQNIPKNRFKTTFPYDHSRIILKDAKSDYINANYIQNVKGEKTYIAAQGPRPNTLADHWMLIWQENVTTIVMLTNLIEGTKKKCEKYWPDLLTESLFGKTKVLLLSENAYAYYVVRKMKVTSVETKSSRTVTQFHYTQWPDHGVPDPLSLVVFHKHVKRSVGKQNSLPILVHCSAGIGRTGTFIGLDALHQQGLETGHVTVEDYVRRMREDRMNMVQNVEQYIFLYEALVESFKDKHDVMTKDTFIKKTRDLQTGSKSPSDWMKSQFEDLKAILKTYSSSEKKAGLENKELNMTRNVLPADRYRVFLTSRIGGRGDYYNAVYLSTFTDKDVLIAGQYPLSGNSVDLFRLLYDNESNIVVVTNKLSDIPSCSEWFSDEKVSLPPFEITKTDTCVSSKGVRKHILKVFNTESATDDDIQVYEIMSWSMADPLPKTADVIADVVCSINSYFATQSEKKPMTILSKDGASGCGLLCAALNATQQLCQDAEVDMFTIVRQLQVRRPEMIATLEEFRFCFTSTLMALDAQETSTNDIYSNEDNVYANT
nr:receptor-type tyrosine-protein phosphatase alpha [Crassostrea gigas]